MIVNYNSIIIKGKCQIPEGNLTLSNTGITLVCGENGAGKTLLAKNIYKNCRNENVSVGMVDQNNSMILRKESVLCNIAMSLDEDEQQYVRESVEQWGFGELLDRNAGTLSGGERRIVCILRELVKANDLLIVDEPTNDLSREWCNIILKLLEEYAIHTPVLVVSHDKRLEKIATAIVHVTREEVKCGEPLRSVVDIDNKFESIRNKNFSYPLLKRNFHVSAVIVLFLLAQILLLFAFLQNAKTESLEEDIYSSNGTELFLPISNNAEVYKEYSLPVSLLTFVNGESSIFEVYKNMENAEESLSHKGAVFCLEKVYAEMSDQIMLRELYAPQQEEYLNASTLGISAEEELDAYLKELVGTDNLYITHMTVLQDQDDALVSKLNELELMNVKIYAFNNSICKYAQNISVVAEVKGMLQLEIFLCIVLLIAFIIYYRNCRTEKRTALLFFQYGFERRDILAAATKRRTTLNLLIGMFVLCFCVAAYMYLIRMIAIRYIVIEYMVVLISAVVVTMGECKIKKRSIKKSFSWRWR